MTRLQHIATILFSIGGTWIFMLLVSLQIPLAAPLPDMPAKPEEKMEVKQIIIPPEIKTTKVEIQTSRNELVAQGKAFLDSGKSPKELPPLNSYSDGSTEFSEFLSNFKLLVFDPGAKKYLGTFTLSSASIKPLKTPPTGGARRIFQQEILSAALTAARSAGSNTASVEVYWLPDPQFDNYLTGKRLAIIAGLKTQSAKIRELRMRYRREGGRPCAYITSVVFTDGREVLIKDNES